MGRSAILSGVLILLSAALFNANASAQPVSANASNKPKPSADDETIRAVKNMLGQKIILDFRYFCEDNTPSSRCRTPMTLSLIHI